MWPANTPLVSWSSPITRIALVVGGVALCIADVVQLARGEIGLGESVLILLLGVVFVASGVTGIAAIRDRPRWWGNH